MSQNSITIQGDWIMTPAAGGAILLTPKNPAEAKRKLRDAVAKDAVKAESKRPSKGKKPANPDRVVKLGRGAGRVVGSAAAPPPVEPPTPPRRRPGKSAPPPAAPPKT